MLSINNINFIIMETAFMNAGDVIGRLYVKITFLAVQNLFKTVQSIKKNFRHLSFTSKFLLDGTAKKSFF